MDAALSLPVLVALERRHRRFVLLFALGCVLSSAYGFLSGAWPFGVVELIWAGVAVARYRDDCIGQANRGGNHINVRTQGVRRLTVWFGQGDGTTDFERPVTVYVNTAKKWERKVTPSRETLLEDLYARGDRQRLYVARVELEVR